MRVVGPGSKGPLSVKEIDARIEAELLYIVELKKRGLSPEEEHKKLHELLKFFEAQVKRLPLPQGIELMRLVAQRSNEILKGVKQ